MDSAKHSNQHRVVALIGFALILAPVLFVSGNILEYELGFVGVLGPLHSLLADPVRKEIFDLTSPFIFLGGPLVALALNLYPVLRLSLKRSDGAIVSGTILKEDKSTIQLIPNLLTPKAITVIPKSEVEEKVASKVSAMPLGMLNTLTKEQILDLLAFLEAGGYKLPPGLKKGGH